MYSSARSIATRSTSSAASSGDGTDADSGRPCPGLVPQVTKGVSVEASISTTASNSASSSVNRVFQYATASSHSCPLGAFSRPWT